MKEDIPVRTQPMIERAPAESGSQELLTVSACVLNDPQTSDLRWPSPPNLFKRAC